VEGLTPRATFEGGSRSPSPPPAEAPAATRSTVHAASATRRTVHAASATRAASETHCTVRADSARWVSSTIESRSHAPKGHRSMRSGD
jgi:hypothetical protein